MPEIASAIQRGIARTCREASVQRRAECEKTVADNLQMQIQTICEYSAAQRPVAKDECVRKVLSSFWLDPNDLKKKLPAKMKSVADDISGPKPLRALDGTTHRSLLTFVEKEAQIYARDEAVPAENRCMNHHERKIFDRMNGDRARFAKGLLKPDCDLVKAARAHSEDLGKNKPEWINNEQFKPHVGSNGSTPHQRITAATSGRFNKTAENTWRSGTSYNLDSSDECQVDLMNSPGHRKNILDPDLTHAGIGIYVRPQDGQVFVTQAFAGLPRSTTTSQRAGGR